MALERAKQALSARLDSWFSDVLQLGKGTTDKTQSLRSTTSERLTDDEITGMLKDDPIAALIVEIVPNEALRSGFEVEIGADGFSDDATATAQVKAQALAKLTNGKCDELKVREKVRETAIWGRAYGAAYAIPAAEDNLQLNQQMGIPSSFTSIAVIDARYVFAQTWGTNPKAPGFGEPTSYQVNSVPTGGGTPMAFISNIHASRVVRMGGVLTPIDQRAAMVGRDWSVLERCHGSLRTWNLNLQNASYLIADSGVGVYKVKDLFGIMASQLGEKLIARVRDLDLTRSIARSIMVDAEDEDYTRRTTTFSGLPEMLDRSMLVVAAAARIPVTILYGQSPAGMNATGESDFRWFYDQIACYQENELRPVLERFIRLIWKANNIQEPRDWKVKFKPLVRPTAKEEAELRKLYADTDAIYIQNQVVEPAEVAVSRFGGGTWHDGMVINEDERRRELAGGGVREGAQPPPDEGDDPPEQTPPQPAAKPPEPAQTPAKPQEQQSEGAP